MINQNTTLELMVPYVVDGLFLLLAALGGANLWFKFRPTCLAARVGPEAPLLNSDVSIRDLGWVGRTRPAPEGSTEQRSSLGLRILVALILLFVLLIFD